MRGRTSNDEQEAFRSSVRAFLSERVVPHVAEWDAAKSVPKSLYAEFGRLGVTGIRIPQEFGGAGETSFIYNVILAEEILRTGADRKRPKEPVCRIWPPWGHRYPDSAGVWRRR